MKLPKFWYMDVSSDLYPYKTQRKWLCSATTAGFMPIITGSISSDDRLLWRSLLDAEMERQMGVFKDRIGVQTDGSVGTTFTDQSFAERYPVLYQFVTSPVDDDGKKRLTSTLLTFVEDGQVKACLRERNVGLTLWVSTGTILGVYEALEEALCTNPPPWRRTDASGATRRVRA